jgi:putative ABC transport system permease protein
MIINTIIFTIRLFRRDKFHSVLNIIGLSTGIACCIVILLYLQHELTYDQYHENADRIYRIGIGVISTDQPAEYAQASWSVGKLLKDEYPEIEDFVRIEPLSGILFRFGDKKFYEDHIALADPSIFKIFTFNFIYGNPDTCLDEPGNLVLTEALARKYFGDTNPIGKVIQLDNKYDCEVTGVVEDMPTNSHMRLNGFVSIVSLSAIYPDVDLFKLPIMEADCYTYLHVNESFSLDNFLDKFNSFRKKYVAEEEKKYHQVYNPIFQQLADIHYGPKLRFDYPVGNIAYIYAFFSIGIFILILACINYINMATARSTVRAKEISMKKILGSEKRHLIYHLLGESLLASFIALLIALGLVELISAVPPFNQLLNGNLKLTLFDNHFFLLGALVLWLFIGLAAGLFPAIYLSSLPPVKALSGALQSGKAARHIRRALVTFQFIISIAVVGFTLFMNEQIEFMRSKDLGFKQENVVTIAIQDDADTDNIPVLLNELRRIPDIISVTTGNTRPGRVWTGLISVEGKNGMEEHNFYRFLVNYDYLATLGIELVKGRDFEKSRPGDKDNAVIVNQKFVEYMGWDNPIGKRLTRGFPDTPSFSGQIIGVVKDFNYYSLHHEIEPMWISLQKKVGGSLIIRFKGERVLEIVKLLESKWEEINHGYPFVYSFLDEEVDRFYDSDKKQNQLINSFSLICIVISCLGLLGLSSFNTSRRTKEIAIRKVNGASALGIVAMLFKEIFYPVAAATIFAIPIAIMLINMWLQNFAYHTGIDILIFAVTAIAALIIAFLTASYHCIRVARTNPVDSLRYE